MYRRFGKRITDIILASALLVVFYVPMILIAAWVYVDSPGPIFFTQRRSGQGRRPFTIYKFRTMSTSAPKDMPTNAFKDSGSYITNAGRIMRKLSLDELPQIFNVLKGDMSIVGPRPVVLQEAHLIALRERVGANDVKPGITGWAQVNGRDEMNDIIKSRYDGEYVKKLGPVMDLKCLYYTVFAVLYSSGVREGHEGDAYESLSESGISVDEG